MNGSQNCLLPNLAIYNLCGWASNKLSSFLEIYLQGCLQFSALMSHICLTIQAPLRVEVIIITMNGILPILCALKILIAEQAKLLILLQNNRRLKIK